jgi:hypothetical protein
LISRLKEAARTFIEFVDERNELVHAHVYSEPDWTQQLVYQGKDKTRTWPLAQIDDLTHRFENSSIALRDLMKEIWNISPLIWRNDGSCPYLATILITLLLAAPSMSLLCAPLGDTIFKEILAKTDNYSFRIHHIYKYYRHVCVSKRVLALRKTEGPSGVRYWLTGARRISLPIAGSDQFAFNLGSHRSNPSAVRLPERIHQK